MLANTQDNMRRDALCAGSEVSVHLFCVGRPSEMESARIDHPHQTPLNPQASRATAQVGALVRGEPFGLS